MRDDEWRAAIRTGECPECGGLVTDEDVSAIGEDFCRTIVRCEDCREGETIKRDCKGWPDMCLKGRECSRWDPFEESRSMDIDETEDACSNQSN